MKTDQEILFYTTADEKIKLEVRIEDETIWLNQKKIAELFGVDAELEETSNIRKFRIAQTEGKLEVKRDIDFYNLDMIIAVGYRVNSKDATQFRIWATATLKDFIIKG